MKTYSLGAHTYEVSSASSGLYLVATPIGNLADISLRALAILAGVDLLACEDTRVTRILLDHYKIRTKTIAYHEHNADSVTVRLLDLLDSGNTVALVSDAGTPLISDPGFQLVEAAHQRNIPIIPIPGASAVLAALVASGLGTDSFFFFGFLSAKMSIRRKQLESLCELDTTLIFYESPHRIAHSLKDMSDILGADRSATLCRELTKKFETIHKATLLALSEFYGGDHQTKGEIVVVIGSPEKQKVVFNREETDRILRDLVSSMSLSQAASEAAQITGQKKQLLYKRLLELKENLL